MKIGEGYKTHMDGDHEVGKEMLLVSGWFRVMAVEPGTFMNCKLYTLEKVREEQPGDRKPSKSAEPRCSRCGGTLRCDLSMVVTCNKCGHWC